MKIDILLEKDPYVYDSNEKEKLFLSAMIEAFDFHCKKNYFFKRMVKIHGIS